ncbi:fungal-specific transcription factor domain-containing protein [Fusarium avenaceum]|nr:fungal-specific transcription factor domain-containing protein [Fusarium avenaceum]
MDLNLHETSSETYPSNLNYNDTPSDNPATGCSPAESNVPPPASTSGQPFLSVRSCITCRRRKVKCDKLIPCANCARHGSKCVFPPPGRARPKPRARAAERILQRSLGGRPVSNRTAPFVSSGSPSLSQSDIHFRVDEGILAKEQWIERWWYIGERLPKRLYMFDAKSGTNVEEEAACEYTSILVELSELLHKASGLFTTDEGGDITNDPDARNSDPVEQFSEEFPTLPNTHALVLSCTSPDSNLSSQHPSPSQIPFYWQTFVENVHPLVKLLHIPTLSKTIRSIQGRVRSLGPPEEALIFAIYFAAVGSMAPEEVRELLGQEKQTLINQYRCATEQALARANFMTSADLMTLQAFILYISTLRQYVEPRLIWNLTALAVRIAQGIGVHLAPNSQESPFDLETRRRLWLCLWMLDLKTGLDLDTDWLIADDYADVGLPLNINDSDLDPAYTEHPTSRTGMTDMAHMLVKYEIGLLLKKLTHARGQKGPRPSNVEEMEELVTKHKEQIRERYLQHCADDGLEWLTAANAKLCFATAPLLIYHPVLSSGLRSSISNNVRDYLVAASIETIECLHVLETMSAPHRRGWIFGTYLHWHATAFLLESLYLRPQETDVSRQSWNALALALGLWITSSGARGACWPWSALVKLVEKGKRIHEASLDFNGQGTNGKGEVVPLSTTRIGVSVELPRQVETASSNRSDIRGSISSMRHELHSIPDGFLETPNPDSWIGRLDDAMSFETSSIRPNFPEFNEQFIPGGSHSVSEFTDNVPISEGSFSTNPAFSGLWLTENPPAQGASWGASQALTESSVDNTTEYWAMWNGLASDLEM